MTVGELINELQSNWCLSDEIVVKHGDKEFEILSVTWYADYYNKEGGSSPAILIED